MQWAGNHTEVGGRSRLTCSGVNAVREEAPIHQAAPNKTQAPHDQPAQATDSLSTGLGSSSFITDAIGYATQHLQYLPFGETFVDQQNGYDSRYTFSAKEKDDETQYSYFGARYFADADKRSFVSNDSDLSVWLSAESADQCVSMDPTGALDDGYTVDLQGFITKVDNTGGEKFDVIYNKADYDAGKKDYDETGTKSGIKIERGTITHMANKEAKEPNKERTKIVTHKYSAYKIVGDEKAQNIVNFLWDNTSVEWGKTAIGTKVGEYGENVITTTRHESMDIGAGAILDELKRDGINIRGMDHNHASNSGTPSGYPGVGGDRGYAYEAEKINPNAVFRIYLPAYGKFIKYNSKGVKK